MDTAVASDKLPQISQNDHVIGSVNRVIVQMFSKLNAITSI
jgi:hypothetical protein